MTVTHDRRLSLQLMILSDHVTCNYSRDCLMVIYIFNVPDTAVVVH